MPAGRRVQRQPTHASDQLRLLLSSPNLELYEFPWPVVYFRQSTRFRARGTGVPERSLRHKVARFAAIEIRRLFEQEPRPAWKVDLKAMATIGRLQAKPALTQQGAQSGLYA